METASESLANRTTWSEKVPKGPVLTATCLNWRPFTAAHKHTSHGQRAGDCFALGHPLNPPTCFYMPRVTEEDVLQSWQRDQTKCKNYLRVTNIQIQSCFWQNQVPKSAFIRTKRSSSCCNTWERQMRRARWRGEAVASAATILVPLHFVSVSSSQDSLVTATGGPDLTWMKHKKPHTPFTQNHYHRQHLLKDTTIFTPSKPGSKAPPCCSHTVCKVAFKSM